MISVITVCLYLNTHLTFLFGVFCSTSFHIPGVRVQILSQLYGTYNLKVISNGFPLSRGATMKEYNSLVYHRIANEKRMY